MSNYYYSIANSYKQQCNINPWLVTHGWTQCDLYLTYSSTWVGKVGKVGIYIIVALITCDYLIKIVV